MKKITLLIILSFLLGACSDQDIKNDIREDLRDDVSDNISLENKGSEYLMQSLSKQGKIKKFKSEKEFAKFLKENETVENNVLYGSKGMMRGVVSNEMMEMKTMTNSDSLASGFGDDGQSGKDFSKTNIQVEGVDEADIVKTDGDYIYVVSKNNLFIIRVFGAEEMQIESKIQFKSQPSNIFILGDKLAIFGDNYNIFDLEIARRWKRRNNFSFLKIFDIEDRKNPKQISNLDFEGSVQNSRLVGDYIYLVLNNYNYNHFDGEPVLPRILENNQELSIKCAGENKCFNPDLYYFDIPYDRYNLTSILSVNIKSPEEQKEIKADTYLMSGSNNIYVSQDNIYLTYTKHFDEYELELEVMRDMLFNKLNIENQEKIKKIEEVANFILSKNEKQRKVRQIIEEFLRSLDKDEQNNFAKELDEKMKTKLKSILASMETTIVHKVSISNGDLEYIGYGEVPGYVLNQFSMDESGDYFRIATTKGSTWSRYLDEEDRKSYNNLYVLDSDLKIAGKVEKLAMNEKIYSVRFMGDRVYMVTFEKIDPLFAISLADPQSPKVLGKLKIPGYSDYLHPYDEDILIGLGKDTEVDKNERVTTKGIKLSLFNVKDLANPKEIDTYILGDAGSESIALHDHKAFLFAKEKNLLVIPVSIREKDANDDKYWGDVKFRGVAVFDIDKDGFELKGKIDHKENNKNNENYYDASVKRSLYIEKNLYTISNNYIKVNNLDSLDSLGNLELKKEAVGLYDDFEVVN